MNALHSFGYVSPVELLNDLVRCGLLESRLEVRLNSLRKSSDSWYAKARAGNSVAEAERQLAEWVAERKVDALASSVEATAKGLLALAQLDTRGEDDQDRDGRKEPVLPRVEAVAIDRRCSNTLPRAHGHEGGVLLHAINPEVPGCGCSQPKGSGIFGRGGKLGLRSIGIALDRELGDPVLILFFPHPEYRSADFQRTRMGYAAVGIDREGYDTGSTIDYWFAADPIEFTLGKVGDDNVVRGSVGSSGIEAALPFPESDAYLAKHLPRLGEYLEAAAATLAGQHAH